MNELAANNSLPATNRTPLVIAAEINSIKDQTRNMVLYNGIEIGRRLVEAKGMIEHGEWGTWLESSVAYSQRTANNLMRIFEEYGADQLTFFGNNAKSQALANLSYTQAVALLGVPAGERDEFIDEHDIDSMSTRELQQAIKDREQALREKQDLELRLKAVEQDAETNRRMFKSTSESYTHLLKTSKGYHEKTVQLSIELEEAKKQLAAAHLSGDNEEVYRLRDSIHNIDAKLQDLYGKIKELERQLREKPIEVSATVEVDKVPEEVERELAELRQRAALQGSPGTVKFRVYFDELVKNFQDLLGTLVEITDPEEAARYKIAVKRLIGKMSERLG